MSTKKGIGYSPLTDRVYIGRQNREKGMWIGEKEDITNDFLAVSSQFFEVNSIREINVSSGRKEIHICVDGTEKGIKGAIKHLQKMLES
jgi:hypothetical protein